jgi:glycosyltransferase involved in cell wall biosynthesis
MRRRLGCVEFDQNLILRVLHIHSGNLFGGVESIMLSLIRNSHYCPSMRHAFALCFDGRLSAELGSLGAEVHRLGDARVRSPFSVLKARRALQKLLREEGFDVLICHSAWSQAIFGQTGRASRKPLIYWLHGMTNGAHWLEKLAKRITPDLVLSVSEAVRETAQNLYPTVEVRTYYAPVQFGPAEFDRLNRRALRASLGVDDQQAVIIQVSRMEPGKGHSVLLQALGQLLDLPGWVCLIVGGPERIQDEIYFGELKKEAQDLGLSDRIRFLGRRSDVPSLLLAADLFCHPNTSPEGFSVAFLEALTAKLPVVATPIGGTLDLIDETCGVLSPQDDAASLSLVLRQLIQRPGLRAALGTNGREKVMRLCDPARQIPRLAGLLEDAVGRFTDGRAAP